MIRFKLAACKSQRLPGLEDGYPVRPSGGVAHGRGRRDGGGQARSRQRGALHIVQLQRIRPHDLQADLTSFEHRGMQALRQLRMLVDGAGEIGGGGAREPNQHVVHLELGVGWEPRVSHLAGHSRLGGGMERKRSAQPVRGVGDPKGVEQGIVEEDLEQPVGHRPGLATVIFPIDPARCQILTAGLMARRRADHQSQRVGRLHRLARPHGVAERVRELTLIRRISRVRIDSGMPIRVQLRTVVLQLDRIDGHLEFSRAALRAPVEVLDEHKRIRGVGRSRAGAIQIATQRVSDWRRVGLIQEFEGGRD